MLGSYRAFKFETSFFQATVDFFAFMLVFLEHFTDLFEGSCATWAQSYDVETLLLCHGKVSGCQNQHCLVADGIKRKPATVKLRHLNQIHAESFENFPR